MALPGVQGLHHIALICSDYQVAKRFYVELLGGTVIAETYRAARQSYKLDIGFPGFELELFTFPAAPARPSTPEAQGLRHLAIRVVAGSVSEPKIAVYAPLSEQLSASNHPSVRLR